MRINHNLAALNTYSRLSAANFAQSKSLEKLSSGQRINRAGDDAAGLAISEKMRSQIKGLDQASRNAQDGISMIQTAEGALTETHSILQRMRELAVQAGNDTNTSQDRSEIQNEVNQLSSEINRIAGNTEFNKQKLLDGGLAAESVNGFSKTIAKVGTNSTRAVYEVSLTCWDVGACEVCMHVDGAGVLVCVETSACTLAGRVAQLAQQLSADTTIAACWSVTSVGNKLVFTANNTCTNAAANYNDCVGIFAVACNGGTNLTYVCTTQQTVRATCYVDAITRFNITDETMKEGVKIDVGGTQIALWDSASGNYTSCSDFMAKNNLNGCVIVFDITSAGAACWNTADKLMGCLVNLSLNSGATWTYDSSNKQICIVAGCTGADGNSTVSVSVYGMANTVATGGNGTTLQVGANVSQTFTAYFGNMTGKGINVTTETAGTSITTKSGSTAYFTSSQSVSNKDGEVKEFALDVSDASKATAAVSALDDAIAAVSSERSKLGAYQNRLEHTIANLGTSSENLTAAESRIRDVDMAKEMMEFNKNNILNQAATAMLAQANQQPQGVLQLLR